MSFTATGEPFIIAEMSGNHNGSLERALKIIEAAAATGADAVKFQTYTQDTITLDSDRDDFLINDENSLWNGRQLYDLYTQAHTPFEWHKPMFDKAKECGILAFSAPFDNTAVDLLESLNAPIYKIASFEITQLPLIRKVAQTGKPLIISTGLASQDDISAAIEAARGAGATDITLLKCTSAYPADARDANLNTMADMAERYGVNVGLSDHTLGIGCAVAAVAMGATVIEKHFMLDKSEEGVDSAFSLDPAEMKMLKEETTRAYHSRGGVVYSGTSNEDYSKRFRQSIWPTRPIAAGETFSEENLKICRPAMSLQPSQWDVILGATATRALDKGERISAQDLKKEAAA